MKPRAKSRAGRSVRFPTVVAANNTELDHDTGPEPLWLPLDERRLRSRPTTPERRTSFHAYSSFDWR